MLPKRETIQHLLSHGPIVIGLDTEYPGVVMPSQFTKLQTLRFGWDLVPPIPDLVVDEYSISGTLVYGGAPFHTVVPWGAIVGVKLDGTEHIVGWPREIEVEVRVEPPKRHLKLVD